MYVPFSNETFNNMSQFRISEPTEKTFFDKVVDLSSDKNTCELAKSYGLNIQKVSWEDTARTKGSCFGHNISDMTLSVDNRNMPVIRKPNYADVTCDRDISNFMVTVGNEEEDDEDIERIDPLKRISLKKYLQNIGKYTGNSKIKDMYLERDEHILCSSQACVLPLHENEVEFNVRLFNYQTRSTDPAVLVIVASSQGTSCQVVTDRNQKLYFNKSNKAANYLAKRLTQDRKERSVALEGAMTEDEKDRNVLFVYQIPLKQKPAQSRGYDVFNSNVYLEDSVPLSSVFMQQSGGMVKKITKGGQSSQIFKKLSNSKSLMNSTSAANASASISDEYDECNVYEEEEEMECSILETCAPPSSPIQCVKSKKKDISFVSKGLENAMLRAGKTFGKFEGTKDFELERDERYPIRCTLQYYKVTDSSIINALGFKELATQLNNIYDQAKAEGSLVIEDLDRKTEQLPHLPGQPTNGVPSLEEPKVFNKPMFSSM
jgi:hypothetical protein